MECWNNGMMGSSPTQYFSTPSLQPIKDRHSKLRLDEGDKYGS